MMKIITNANTDPHFNLAAEEYFMSVAATDIFMLWRNAPAVIIGKNQNAWAEVNVPYAEENKITVVRRLTGGGAVFHDLGNVNFTFITKADKDLTLDFARFTEPVIAALGKLGVRAELSGRNDILADGAKISGNAQCVYKQPNGNEVMLHHGTLLFSADMKNLIGALNVRAEKIQSKGISSIKSRVKNIRDLLPGNDESRMSADEFLTYLTNAFCERYQTKARALSDEETAEITKLRDEKYARWEWNFGQSKQYGKTRGNKFDFGWLEIMLTADAGIVQNVKIHGDFFGFGDVSEIESALTGVKFTGSEASKALAQVNIEKIISGCTSDNILSLMFE